MLTYATRRTQSLAYRPSRKSPIANWPAQSPAVRQILRAPAVQPKLTIGAPNDKYEQEADRVAGQVMRMPEAETVRAKTSVGDGPRIQRVCSECDEELQRKPSGTKAEDAASEQGPILGKGLNTELSSQISMLRGRGQPLSDTTRAFFEPRFGQDFSSVRIHTGQQATDSAKSVQSRAYTLGRDVVFGAGEYRPHTNSGKHLLAHELTHVVQQTRAQNNDRLQSKRVPVTATVDGAIVQRRVYEGHDHGGRYEIDDDDCTYRYHQNWFFDFRTEQTEPEREQYMQAARQQIQDVWSGKFPLIPDLESCACYPSGFSVTVEMHPHERERQGRGFTAIITTTEERGFTNQPLRNIDLGTEHEQPLNMGRDLTQQRVAHEFGHTIGLTDEYHGWAGLFNTRGSRDRPSIMHSGDQVRPRHYQHFADMINLEIGSGCTYSPAGRRVPAYENPLLSVTGIPFTDLTPRADFIIGLNIDRRVSNSAILGLVYPTVGLMSMWDPEDQTSLVGPTVGLRLNQIAHPLYVNVRTGVLFDPVDPTSVEGIHIPIAAELGVRQEGFQAGINYTAISNVLGSGGWTHLVGVGVRVELPDLSELVR